MSEAANRVPVTVIVPTLDEELNLAGCLESVQDWAGEIVVIDAGSRDDTVAIARKYTDRVYVHSFGRHKYAEQKNWALTDLDLSNDWVLFLDADERVTPELRDSIAQTLASPISADIAGFTINVRLVFLGRPIEHGLYAPNWALRLFHRERVRFLKVGGLEYARANDSTRRIGGLIMHCDRKDLFAWIAKQNERSTLEANAMMMQELDPDDRQNVDGRVERRGRARATWWQRLPLLVRPLLLFVYGYLVRLGFLDGREGFVYSFLMSLWYRFLVDAKYIELTKRAGQTGHGI